MDFLVLVIIVPKYIFKHYTITVAISQLLFATHWFFAIIYRRFYGFLLLPFREFIVT